MYKHSTTHRTLSRRLAALLAALALLAAMALPVYAEALDDATQMQETVETDSNGKTDNKVETGSDDETDDKSETNEPTTPAGKEAAEDSTANADGNNASKNEDTNDNASPSTTGDSNTTAGNTVNDTLQTLPADNIDPTTDKTTMDDTPDTMDEDAKQDIVTRSADGAEESHITQVSAAQASDSSFKIYFAVPTKFATNNYTGVKLNYQKSDTSNNNGWPGMKNMELLQSRDYSGRKVYEITISPEECPEYFREVQFHYVNANGNIVEGDGNFEKLSGYQYRSNIANKLYDADSKTWEDFTPYDPNNHQTFAGKTMLFQNQSDRELTDVKAIFYENDQEVAIIDLGALGAIAVGKRVSFKIPEKDCSYICFRVDGVETPLYSFYGQQDGGVTDKSFIYDSGKAFCYIYQTNDNGSWATPQGKNKVYFDATFSKLKTNSANDTGGNYSIPAADSTSVYYRAKGEGVNFASGSMTQDSTNSNLYYVELNAAYTEIAFSQVDLTNDTISANNGQSTAWEIIPQTYENPCFYADTYDDSVYGKGPRSGYWDKKGEIRDAEKGKKKNNDPVVDVPSTDFTPESNTKYINTTLYDYYTDWELNGNNRDSYAATFNKENFACHRNWVTFRQFDQALSDYYQKDSTQTVLYPMYTGQFQPAAYDKDDGKLWGIGFAEVADSLNLYGYSDKDKNKFMAVNNSTIDVNGTGLKKEDTKYYDDAFQGLTGDTLVNGEPVLYGTELTVPYFNKDFLLKSNSKNAKLGKVYDNVSFPFTKKTGLFKDKNEEKVEYWYFDSNDTTLYLKQDTGNKGYFLKKSADKARSRNLKSNSEYQDGKETYGFFPFNENSTNHQASTYNYGFGAKLKFQFTMNEDGQVYGTDGETKVPIKFFFSGDDDVWVYIDDELALDVGGDHGKVSGLLEFGLNNEKQLVYTPYVSDVKASNAARMYQYDSSGKSVEYLNTGNNIPFHYKGTEKPITPGTHTLTMYYMERGMWESNMAIAFNFPDSNELQVQKIVDDKNVNKLFAGCFDNQRFFNFTIRNQATHYGTVDTKTDNVSTINLLEPKKSNSEQKDFTATANPATTTTGSGNIFEIVENPPGELNGKSETPLLKWYAKYKDLEPEPGSHKEDRYGKLELNKPIDITGMSYLSFDIYVDSDKGDAALSNMYLQLRDSQGNPKGCLDKTFIGGKMLYGQVEMHNRQWITVKLSLDDMQEQGNFDWKNVKELLFGCNYPRDIYLRNIVFSAKAVPTKITGFTTKQDTIADYGSAKTGTLMPAENAQYTSDAEKGTMVVDKNGGFVLQNNETVTFKDQFRRGSYLSINEQVDTNLFDTQWTIYEDGMPVKSTTAGESKKLTLKDNKQLSLENQTGTAPDDGRIELTNAENAEGVDAQKDNIYNGKKPDDKTIVFRSYAKPDATEADGETQLKVVFVNTVKTGSLTIVKQKAQDSDPLKGTYHFKVRFTDVGGHALGDKKITWEFDLAAGKSETLEGIPVGTRFTIEEEAPTDGSKLVNVSITGGGDDRKVMSNNTVRGSISVTDTEPATVTFTNSMQETLDITGEKQWRNADDSPMTEHPAAIYVQLQRRHVGETPESPWTPVIYLDETYTEVEQDHDGMNFSFLGLPAKDYSKNDKPDFEYRVVEGSVDKTGFHAVKDGETITIGEKVYGVEYNPKTVTADKKSSVTITNKQQDPKFTLDITKKDAENVNTPLKDVEFTLEKMTTDDKGNTVADTSFGTLKGKTNDQGKLMWKKDDNSEVEGFKELEAGTYRLTETKAAENYNLLSAPIEVEFTKTGQCSLNSVNVEVSTKDTDKPTAFIKYGNDSYTLKLTVLNRKTPALPHTGADAPSLWLLIGLPLAVAGLLILVFRYNKKGGRTR